MECTFDRVCYFSFIFYKDEIKFYVSLFSTVALKIIPQILMRNLKTCNDSKVSSGKIQTTNILNSVKRKYTRSGLRSEINWETKSQIENFKIHRKQKSWDLEYSFELAEVLLLVHS